MRKLPLHKDAIAISLVGILFFILIPGLILCAYINPFKIKKDSSGNFLKRTIQFNGPGTDTSTELPSSTPLIFKLEQNGPSKSGLIARIRESIEKGDINKEAGERLIEDVKNDRNLPE